MSSGSGQGVGMGLGTNLGGYGSGIANLSKLNNLTFKLEQPKIVTIKRWEGIDLIIL